MVVMNGKRAIGWRCFSGREFAVAASMWLLIGCLPALAPLQQDPAQAAEIELQALRLAEPGADGRDAREAAVERLLTMPVPAAHRVLQQVLDRDEDRDAVQLSILAALQRHLLFAPTAQFGAASADVRREILTGYLGVLAHFWRLEPGGEVPVGAAGAMARGVVQRINAREFEEACRTLLAVAEPAAKAQLFRCIADTQQVYLAQVLADHLEDGDAASRQAAGRALQMLTFHDTEFVTRAQFGAWFERNREVRYVDLAERAARAAERRVERAREEQALIRIDAAREFVRAHTSRKPGIDWAEIQSRTLVDDPAVLDACLELLQQSLAVGLPPDESAGARQTFCRALVQRWRAIAPDQVRRRTLLLEVAAYTARAEETEIANELGALLLAQLESGTVDEQIAALRGLRRFPTVDTRAKLVRYCSDLLQHAAAGRSRMEVAIATLSSRTTPRWYAPGESDEDKTEWLALIQSLCTRADWQELRDVALQLALCLDARDQRVAAVFGLLLEFAKDRNLDVKFRSACLIHLQGWRDQERLVDGWVLAMQTLLDDMAPEIRQLAAESLARLAEVVDSRRGTWITATIMLLRDRLRSEPSPRVLRALVDSMQVCGREPQMPEKAIGALNYVLAELGTPVPPEHQFRLEPLLTALATIAGDPRADRGQWIGACKQLEQYDKRQSLRLVLLNQAAADLAKDIGSPDGGLADRARDAMVWMIRTGLMKTVREGSWGSTEELLREARDLRVAFSALDTLDEAQRLDEPKHRLLRLEVEIACGKYQEVVQRTSQWLAGGSPSPAPGAVARPTFTADQRERLRCLAAEAQLGLGKPEIAARSLAERDGDQAIDSRTVELQGRIAKALLATDPTAAVALFEKVLKSTLPEDAQFRTRLIDWASARVRFDASLRAATLVEVERYAGLFDAQDCPPEQRDAFLQLRGTK